MRIQLGERSEQWERTGRCNTWMLNSGTTDCAVSCFTLFTTPDSTPSTTKYHGLDYRKIHLWPCQKGMPCLLLLICILYNTQKQHKVCSTMYEYFQGTKNAWSTPANLTSKQPELNQKLKMSFTKHKLWGKKANSYSYLYMKRQHSHPSAFICFVVWGEIWKISISANLMPV